MEEYIGAPGGESLVEVTERISNENALSDIEQYHITSNMSSTINNYTSDEFGNIVPKYKLVGCREGSRAEIMHRYHVSEARKASKEQFKRTWTVDLDKDIEKVVDDNFEELLDSQKGGKGACTEFGFVDQTYYFGKKESNGKLSYELDFEFIRQMAERMATNKGKYPPYNWKKPVDIEDLKQATFRHILEIMEGRYEDDGREFGHLEALALNSMFINYQLNNGQ